MLEPVTAAMLAGLPEVSAHFGRFRVTEIALSQQALGQFDDGEILRAAELLSHAKLHCIGWNGTSSAGSASTPMSGCASASPRQPGSRPAPRCWR